MRTYHLYYLRDTTLVGFDHIRAANDVDAARIARQQGQGDITEIWNAEGRVRIVPSAPATAKQAPSGSE
jgi:hypothetical protein